MRETPSRASISVNAAASCSIIVTSMTLTGGCASVMVAQCRSKLSWRRVDIPRSAGPKSFPIVIPDHSQFISARRACFLHIVSDAEFPSGVGNHVIYAHTRMIRCEIGFAVFAEPQDAFCGD